MQCVAFRIMVSRDQDAVASMPMLIGIISIVAVFLFFAATIVVAVGINDWRSR